VKPLLAKELPTFLKRFDNFVDAELRHVEVVSPTVIKVSIAGQDTARAFDWLVIEFEFNGVSDAKLLDSSKLLHVDMCDGISLIYEDNCFTFSIGKNETISSSKNSIFYIVGSSLKYNELHF